MSIVDWPKITPGIGVWAGIDGPSLLAAACALQLRLDNVHGLVRLERLAAVAARLPASPDARSLSSSAVKKMLAVNEIGGPTVSSLEDAYEGIYVLEVPFFGGPRLVLQGQATDCGKSAITIMTAVFRAADGVFPPDFLTRSKGLARFLLDLSDRVCRAAGLTRGDVPVGAERVTVPAAATIAKMSSWVQFSFEDLFGSYPDAVREYLVDTLIQEQAELSALDNEEFLDEYLLVKPLIRSGTVVTVAAPAELMACLRHHIILDAYTSGCVEPLAEALRELTVDRARELLAGTADGPFEVLDSETDWTRIAAPFDGDKTIDVFVLVDDLDDYDPNSPYGTWNAWDALASADRASQSGRSAPDRTLRLFLWQGMGRDLAVGVPAPEEETTTLFLSVTDLETILQTPGTDSLSLWYFARASTRLHEQSQVLSFSTVDLYATYRDYDCSFYMSDDAKPSMVSIEVAYGQTLRAENYRHLDLRHVVHPVSQALVDAYSMHGRSSPVYMTNGSAGVSFYVDLGATSGWVHLERSKTKPPLPAGALFDVGEAIAYWLWQVADHAPPLVESPAGQPERIELVVRAADSQAAPTPWLVGRRSTNDRRVLEIAGPPDWSQPAALNQPDREIVAAIINALMPSQLSKGQAPIDPPAVIDAVAPPGQKKMLHVFGPNDTPFAWPGGLQSAWHLSDEAVSEVLDELGDHLVHEQHMNPGPIPDDRRNAVLNGKVVPWLIDQLTAAIATLSPDGLIERLIDRNEALISSTARDAIHLPARLACFGPSDDEVQKIEHRQRTTNSSMLASRFLIEYASAFPPKGALPFTREAYNRLLALASEIIHKGMLSDSIQHRLSDTHLAILDSRRLGLSRDDDQYVQALNAFAHARAETTLADAQSGDQDENPTSHPVDIPEADLLARDEFGFSYTELAEACGKLIEIADAEDNSDVVTIDESRLEEQLGSMLSWNRERVDVLISRLVLEHTEGDVHAFWKQGIAIRPWRFSRERSYLRRPLIRQHQSDEATPTFGRRAIRQAPNYWLEQYRSGRLQAQTAAMRSALSQQRNQKGQRFERLVADRLAQLGYAPVRTRLRRVGRVDFRNVDGSNLGDIDIAAVHTGRNELLVLEVKDLETARTPAELTNEVDNLIGEGNSAIRRLKQRATWVKQHLDATLGELGVHGLGRSWNVRPLVVVNEALLSETLISAEIPVVSYPKLEATLAEPDSDRRRRRRAQR